MRSAIKYLLVFMLIQMVSTLVVTMGYKLFEGGGAEEVAKTLTESEVYPAAVIALSSALFSVATLIVFLRKKWCVVSGNYINTRPWLVLLWSALFIAGFIIPVGLLQELTGLRDYGAAQMKTIIGSNFGFLVVCIFAPVVEEVVFRGAILRKLLGKFSNSWVAILISAALFALAHLNPGQMPGALLCGIFLGWIYKRTGSIVPGIVAHWTNNAIAFVVMKAMPWLGDMNMSEIFAGDKRTIGLAVIFSLFILLPSLYQLNLLTKSNGAARKY